MLGRPRTLAMAAACALVLSGCGAAASASQAVAKAAPPETLVFYSAQGYDQAAATAFQKATGIQVKLNDMSTGPLVAKVQAEEQNPHWDVIWFDGNGAMQSLDSQHQLLRGWLPANSKDYTALGRMLLPADHAYFPTGVTAAGAIAYNTRLVKPSQVPHSFYDLLKPQFKNAVGMNNPAISGPTFPLVAGMFKQMGVAGGQRFFKDLKAHGMKIYATNGVTLQALEKGTIKAAMFQDSAQLGAAMKANSNIKVVYPVQGVTMLPSDIAINAHAPDMAAAKAFVSWVLSKQGQKVMQDINAAGSDSLFQPLITGVKPLVKRANVKWNVVSPVWAGNHEAAWIQWFTNNVVR